MRANSSFILPLRLFPPFVHYRAIYFPSLDRDLLLDGTHTKIRGNGRRASEKEGRSRASVRISPTLAPSPAFSHRIPHQPRDQPLSTANVDTRRAPGSVDVAVFLVPVSAQYRESYGGTGREKEFNRCVQSSWSVLLLLAPLSPPLSDLSIHDLAGRNTRREF